MARALWSCGRGSCSPGTPDARRARYECALIAALIQVGTPPDLLYKAWRVGRFDLVTSTWQLDEFRRASRYPRVRAYLKPAAAGTLLNALRREATVLKDLPDIRQSPDRDDDPVLAMAVASDADYLVSGDRRGLRDLGKIGQTRIVSARGLLDTLGLDPDRQS